MPFDKTGTLIVNTLLAGGALPVVGSVVRIIGTDEENRLTEYSVITDIDGATARITLPAPSRELSQAPGATEQAYALYNIEVSAPGFYTKRMFDVSVFEGEETLQLVNMIPMPKNKTGVTYPRNNLEVSSRENERLE